MISRSMHFRCIRAAALLIAALPFPAHAWAPTATKAIAPLNLTSLGPVTPSTPIHITVSLNLRNRDGLLAYIDAISTRGNPLYNTRLTGAQFAASYSPTPAQAQSVAAYLSAQGFSNIAIAPNRLLIDATGTARAVQSAFNTTLLSYRVGDRLAFANGSDAQVPDTLGGIVLAVLGLQTLEPYRTHALPAVKSVLGYSPWAFQQAYHVGALPWAAGIRIAIFTAGDMNPVISDLRTYESHFGLPAVAVAVIRGAGSNDRSGTEEWDLDTQISTGIAHNVGELRLYAADSMFDADLIPSFNRFVVENSARAGSASFGICEAFSTQTGAVASEDNVFMQGVAQGQTIFAATGDVGSGCSIPIGLPAGLNTNGHPLAGVPLMVEMPAASPYIVGVGGTTLVVDANYNRSQEVAWSAGGGGLSVLEPAPSWQKQLVSPLAAIGRGVPDIAMDADPNTGAIIFFNDGEIDGVGGTSLSAPLALGAWARILQAHGGALGFAAPIFYGLHPKTTLPATPTVAVTGFRDILVGCNGFYCATPKWDYVTGLGTPDIETLSHLIH